MSIKKVLLCGLVTVILVIINKNTVPAFDKILLLSSSQKSISNVANKPQYGVEYSNAVRFKLASRKTTYKIGELVSLDLAILNISTNNLYTRISEMPALFVRKIDEKKEESVRSYKILDYGVTPRSFSLIKNNQMISRSILILAGCQINNYQHNSNPDESLDDRDFFEQNGFVNNGQACLNIAMAGDYIVTAEQVNYSVVLSPEDSDAKTTVGLIRSTPLRITIEK